MPHATIGIDAGREALREELGWEYLAQQNSLYHPDKNALFTFRHHNPFVSPVEVVAWDDVNKAFRDWTPDARYLTYVDGVAALYSKRVFRYGMYGFYARLPDPTDVEFNFLHLGAETTGAAHGGICTFFFDVYGGAIRTRLFNYSINWAGIRAPDVSALLPFAPNDGLHRYLVKVNRASVEYWAEGQLVGIVQFSPNSDTYDVRTTAPYYLGQVRGHTPYYMPALIEYSCSAADYIGHRSNIQLTNIYVTDGDPAPPRTLHPYTNGSAWEGTTIDSGTLTSDRIPVAGYDKKTILFLANQAGTLYIDVDYGDNSDDEFDSVPVSADTLESYLTRHDILWLRLRFTPSSYPCTITRARVLMS